MPLRYKLYAWYLALSFGLLPVSDDTPLWAIFLVVLNLGNAVRLVNKIPISTNKKSKTE